MLYLFSFLPLCLVFSVRPAFSQSFHDSVIRLTLRLCFSPLSIPSSVQSRAFLSFFFPLDYTGFVCVLQLNNSSARSIKYSKFRVPGRLSEPTLHLAVVVFDCSSLAYVPAEANKKTATRKKKKTPRMFCSVARDCCTPTYLQCFRTKPWIRRKRLPFIWFSIRRLVFAKQDRVPFRIKLCLLLWLGLFYTMKPLLSVRRDFSTRCREIRFGSSRIQSANLH